MPAVMFQAQEMPAWAPGKPEILNFLPKKSYKFCDNSESGWMDLYKNKN